MEPEPAPAKVKDLVIPLFGAGRLIGTFPTKVHSDMRHLAEMYRRGKMPRLAADRLSVLEAALAQGSAYRSAAELRAQMEVWREEGQKSFDADLYYDRSRTTGYTEHNRGPQENLSARVLQFCSFPTEAEGCLTGKKYPLLVDLGCGSGLSTLAAVKLPRHTAAVIGVDLSSEMLRGEAWEEVASLRVPMAGERLRSDLGHPLPFRSGVFDGAYSVSAVHYLAEDAFKRTAEDRVGALTSSLRRCLASDSLPCTLQAYLTRGASSVAKFQEASRRDGWALCDLVIDQAHESSATRDFLYLLPRQPTEAGPPRPPRCALYRQAGATCALALQSWAAERGLPPVQIDALHRAWLGREHQRFARRLVRLQRRCSVPGLELDHAAPPDAAEEALAASLATVLEVAGEGQEESEERSHKVLAILHGEGAG